MKDEKEFNEIIAYYFNMALNECHPLLLLHEPDKVKIIAPKYAIDRLAQHYLHSVRGSLTNNKYCGYDLISGYEKKIIIYNEKAPEYNRIEQTYYELELK